MGVITNAQSPDLAKVRDGPIFKNQHVSVPSDAPINIQEISGSSINSRTRSSMCNLAEKLTAELVSFKLWSVS